MPVRWDGEVSRRTPHDDVSDAIVRAGLELVAARARGRKLARLHPEAAEAAWEIEEGLANLLVQLDALADGVQDLKRRHMVRVHGRT